MTQKLILTDADGVLFDWVSGFTEWATDVKKLKLRADFQDYYFIEKWFCLTKQEGNELVAEYNDSAAIGFLPAYLDSIKYVNKLNQVFGYKFVVITAMGYGKYAERLRWRNLQETFGDVFVDLHITDLRQCKSEYLSQYDSTIWIEDKPSNAEAGFKLGHRTYLLEHDHNSELTTSDGITRVHTWKELYESIAIEEGQDRGILLTPELQKF